MGVGVRPKEHFEPAVIHHPTLSYRPQTLERFMAESPKHDFQYFIFYVYLTCINSKDPESAIQQATQIRHLNETLKKLETRHPQATFLLQGDWNLAVDKSDTIHFSPDGIALPKHRLHSNANLFRNAILPRFKEIYQPIDTLHGKTQNSIGRNDRAYCKVLPGLQYLWEIHTIAKTHRWGRKKDKTPVKLSDHCPILTRIQRPHGFATPQAAGLLYPYPRLGRSGDESF